MIEACFDENEMTGNNFGDEGARVLCDLIRTNTALNDLNLSSQLIPMANKKQFEHFFQMNRLWDWRQWSEISERSMGRTRWKVGHMRAPKYYHSVDEVQGKHVGFIHVFCP